MFMLKVDQVLIEQVEKCDNIIIIKNVVIKQIVVDNGKVSVIEYQDRVINEEYMLLLVGVFV